MARHTSVTPTQVVAQSTSFFSAIRDRHIALIAAAGVLVLLGLISPMALLVTLRDGWIALAILAAATGLGLWIVKALRLESLTLAWRGMLSVSLGLGSLSLLTFALGSLGMLQRPLWIALLCLFIAIGVPECIAIWRHRKISISPKIVPHYHWAWLLIISFAALSLFGAALPPGLLWPGEGNGYDVLEYHLGAQRDYFDAGRIHFLPHNIYSNFPANTEMMYLLSMILHGDPVAAVFTAQIFHTLLGFLTIAAVWLAGREIGPRAAIAAALAIATCPFLVYLSGLAYVENGLLFFSAMACATLLHMIRDTHRRKTWAFVAGLLCGCACGCKYTAVPMILIPLATTLFIFEIRRSFRFPLCALFLLGSLVTFGPWMLRNIVNTGNPVFPLAYEVFGAKSGVWNAEGASRWHEGHLPKPEESSLTSRFSKLWNEVVANALYGLMIALGMVAGLGLWVRFIVYRKTGKPVFALYDDHLSNELLASFLGMCWLILLIGGGTWLMTTHLVGRFAIVLLIPTALLLGLALERKRHLVIRIVTVLLLLAAVGFNMVTTWRLFASEPTPFISIDRNYGLAGNTNWFTQGRWVGTAHIPALNALLADGKRILVVGDARRFYLRAGADYDVVFNPNPFADAAGTQTPDKVVQWLRDRGYSYVYVDWGEMRRLRKSRYGFWKSIDEPLFEAMTKFGLPIVQNFETKEGGKIYSTLFEVSPAKE